MSIRDQALLAMPYLATKVNRHMQLRQPTRATVFLKATAGARRASRLMHRSYSNGLICEENLGRPEDWSRQLLSSQLIAAH